MQNYIDDDEAEETLSFCDLQFCNDNDDASGSQETFSLENDQSSSSSLSLSSTNDQELFEFFSGWSSTSASFSFNTSSAVSDDSVNFCGKLIPRKQFDPENEFSHRKIPEKYTRNIFGGNSDTSFYQRSKSAFISSKTTTPRSNSLPVPAKYSNIPTGNSSGRKDILSKRVSMLTSSSSTTKSRWFLFMFGMSSSTVPKKMELGDLRSRQSRRNPSTMFCSVIDGGDKEVAGGGHHENTVRKYSFGCFGGL